MNKNPIFVTNARVAGHSYPAHELLESYAVTLYDLVEVMNERYTHNINRHMGRYIKRKVGL